MRNSKNETTHLDSTFEEDANPPKRIPSEAEDVAASRRRRSESTLQSPLETYLREINDWVVKFQLQTVPGVTAILSIGGHVLQYQLRVDPFALQKYGLSLDDLVEAVRENNRNAGGQFLLLGSEEHLVRGIGLLQNLDGEESPHPGGVAGDFGPPGFSWQYPDGFYRGFGVATVRAHLRHLYEALRYQRQPDVPGRNRHRYRYAG